MAYEFREELFLRAPAYSFALYDPGRLPETLLDKAYQDALYLASPGFYGQLRAKAFSYDLLTDKERHTALKYYNRMSFRPVPYGSFASFTNLCWAASGTTHLQPAHKNTLHLLPDMELLQATGTAPSEKIQLNPLLYQVGGQYRYIRSEFPGSKPAQFILGAVGSEAYYGALFRLLKGRAMGVEELIAFTCTITGCGEEEAGAHLDFMLSQQILMPPSQYSPIQPSPEKQIAGWRAKLPRGHGSLADMGQLCAPGIGLSVPRFYAALERPLLDGGPGPAVKEALKQAIFILQNLTVANAPAALANFTEAFRERFDQEMVPILEAVDPDTGIVYGNLVSGPTEDDVQGLPFPSGNDEKTALPWTAAHRLLLQVWQQDGSSPARAPVEISTARLEVAGITPAPGHFPPSTSIVFREVEEHILLEQAGGATAISMVGRFSAFSKAAHQLCRNIAAAEQAANPGIVFADIGQLSALHTDNINRRRPIYPYEIPLNTISSLPSGKQLRPSDLYLAFRDGQLTLYSKSLRKRVIPRLATAYNHQNTQLSIFRLLCDLQYQGLNAALSFDPETFFPGLGYYPRFYTGRVVLSLAKWYFTAADMASLSVSGSESALDSLRAFREKHGLPQRVSLGATDQQLVFDLSYAPEALFFLDCLKGQKKVKLQEYLLTGRTVKSGHMPYAGQFIAFLQQDAALYPPLAKTPAKAKARRAFPPGSDWLYLKLYCTPAASGLILTGAVAPALMGCKDELESWHFVRFNDPGYHLRLRVKLKTGKSTPFLEKLQLGLAASGLGHLVKEFRADTYRRELERYHPALIGFAEGVFRASSDEALSLITATDEGPASVFRFTLSGVWAMAASFFPDEGSVMAFCETMSESFQREFRADKPLRAALDAKFREMRGLFSNFLFGAPTTPERQELIRAIAIARNEAANLSEKEQHELLASFVHMHVNRCFRENQRKQELLLYYCLAKYLRSLKKQNEATPASGTALAGE